MKQRILVVDDSVAMARQLTKVLVEDGHEVVGHAKNGAEALTMHATTKPDLVIMDIVMPMMDGIEALRALMRVQPDARVIVVSSLGAVESKVEAALKLGAAAVITKPFEAAQVRAAVQRASAGRGLPS